jgi:hypothetical protein
MTKTYSLTEMETERIERAQIVRQRILDPIRTLTVLLRAHGESDSSHADLDLNDVADLLRLGSGLVKENYDSSDK